LPLSTCPKIPTFKFNTLLPILVLYGLSQNTKRVYYCHNFHV
jgi:hypothetical protein